MGIIHKFIRILENHLAADISPSRAAYAANDNCPEDRDETANEIEKSPSKLRMGIGRMWASIKRRPAFWATIALCIITVCYHSYTLYLIQHTLSILTQDVRRSIFLKAYDYKVVQPDDERFTTFMNNQGALGWRIVHARRATKKAADGWTNIPIYELILERERIIR